MGNSKYKKIIDWLRSQIDGLPAGSRLESENELLNVLFSAARLFGMRWRSSKTKDCCDVFAAAEPIRWKNCRSELRQR